MAQENSKLRSTKGTAGGNVGAPFPMHVDYLDAVSQVHSRPVSNLSLNSIILHFAFMSDGGASVPHTLLTNLCRQQGEPVPDKHAVYHEINWGDGKLRWEKHSEFTTFTFNAQMEGEFLGEVENHPFGENFNAPGSLISACRIEVRKQTKENLKLLDRFDQRSLCATEIGSNKSLIATDFRQDNFGRTAYLLLADKMQESRIGFYVKSALEMETYRTLAMLGMPLAQKLSKKLSKFELEMAHLTRSIRGADAGENEKLLSEINDLSAELEADSAASLFRFGATKAYGNIATTRASFFGASNQSGYVTLLAFLNRSLKPAMLTCSSIEQRQENISQKLARTANLLRTRVEIAIEHQNRNLLESMDKRTQLQFRLQQTVEGLSIAAVSYYVVGLLYYLANALSEAGLISSSPKLIAGISVPFVILSLWMFVRHLRSKHME